MKAYLTFIVFLLPFVLHAQIITTYAGNGSPGDTFSSGVPAIYTGITSPRGVKLDNSNNLLFVGLTYAHWVNRATGIISIIAGSDTASSAGGGGDGGLATCANLIGAEDICVDFAGNYYIADAWYSEIRKVNIINGLIDTFAGNRNVGSYGDGGPAKNAALNNPSGVTFDTGQHYLYIANCYDYRVRKVDVTTNTISAFAGTGINGYGGDEAPAISAKFSRVLGICVDRHNNVYIGDWDNARVRKVDAGTGIVTTFAGNGIYGYSGDGGLAIDARISKPTGLCFDKCGNFYFSNEDSNVIRRIDVNTGIITTIAGNGTAGFSGDSGLAINAQFNHPTGVAIDDSGNLFAGDYYNHRIRKVTIYNPYIHITASPNDTVIAGTITTFTTTVSGGGDAPAYQWYVNGSAIAGATNSTYAYTPADGDSVNCLLTSNSQCVGNHTANSNVLHIKVWALGVHDVNSINSKITLYPNPTSSTVTITSPLPINNLTITNTLCQQIYTHTFSTTQAEIDISHLPQGMYIVRVNDMYVQKLVKE